MTNCSEKNLSWSKNLKASSTIIIYFLLPLPGIPGTFSMTHQLQFLLPGPLWPLTLGAYCQGKIFTLSFSFPHFLVQILWMWRFLQGSPLRPVSVAVPCTEQNTISIHYPPYPFPLSTPCPAHAYLTSGPIALSKQLTVIWLRSAVEFFVLCQYQFPCFDIIAV